MKSKDKLCSAKLIVVSNFLNNFYSSRSYSGRLSIYRRLHKHHPPAHSEESAQAPGCMSASNVFFGAEVIFAIARQVREPDTIPEPEVENVNSQMNPEEQ